MSTYYTGPPTPGAPPEHIPSTIPPRKQGKSTALLAALASGLICSALGVGIAVLTMEPETIVETKEVEVEVPAEMPAICGSAYKLAEETLLQYEALAPLFTDAMTDVNRRDMAALEAHSSQIKTVQEDIFTELKGYYLAKYTCEEALGITLPEAVAGPTAPGLSTPSSTRNL